MKNQLCPELMPILNQLQSEGHTVYTYQNRENELTSLFWFENGRVLNIQSSSWRNTRYARDRFNIGVSYIPSRENGSGCGLSMGEVGDPASELLKYRTKATWVNGITNYKSMRDFLNRENGVLKFSELDANGNLNIEIQAPQAN